MLQKLSLRYGTGYQGGYMPDGMGGSQSSPGSKRAGLDTKNTVRPVTIRQIIEAHSPHPDADFQIDDVDVGQVRRSRVIVDQDS